MEVFGNFYSSKKSVYVFMIFISNLPGFISSFCFIFTSTSYKSFSLFIFSFLCPTTLLTFSEFTTISISFTLTLNLFIFSNIESYQMLSSTSCPKAS